MLPYREWRWLGCSTLGTAYKLAERRIVYVLEKGSRYKYTTSIKYRERKITEFGCMYDF